MFALLGRSMFTIAWTIQVVMGMWFESARDFFYNFKRVSCSHAKTGLKHLGQPQVGNAKLEGSMWKIQVGQSKWGIQVGESKLERPGWKWHGVRELGSQWLRSWGRLPVNNSYRMANIAEFKNTFDQRAEHDVILWIIMETLCIIEFILC